MSIVAGTKRLMETGKYDNRGRIREIYRGCDVGERGGNENEKVEIHEPFVDFCFQSTSHAGDVIL